jgi:hypothetical protein
LTYRISIRRTLCGRRLGALHAGFEQFSPECVVPPSRWEHPVASRGPSGTCGTEASEQGTPYPGVPSQEASAGRQRPSPRRQLAILVVATAALGSGRVPRDCRSTPSGAGRRGSGVVLAPGSASAGPAVDVGRHIEGSHPAPAVAATRLVTQVPRGSPRPGDEPPESAPRCMGTRPRGIAPAPHLGMRPPRCRVCPTRPSRSSGSAAGNVVVESGSPGEQRATGVGNGVGLQRTPQRSNAPRSNGHVSRRTRGQGGAATHRPLLREGKALEGVASARTSLAVRGHTDGRWWKPGEPHGRQSAAIGGRTEGGASRRGGEKPRGRNESGPWQDPTEAGFGLWEHAPEAKSTEGSSLTYEEG